MFNDYLHEMMEMDIYFCIDEDCLKSLEIYPDTEYLDEMIDTERGQE